MRPPPPPAHLSTSEKPADEATAQTPASTPEKATAPAPQASPSLTPEPSGPSKPKKAPGNDQLAPGSQARPSTKSHVGTETSVDRAEGVGGVVIGREVTLQLVLPSWPKGLKLPRIRIDLLTINPSGLLEGIEVKFGEFAGLTPNQAKCLPRDPLGGTVRVTMHGENAKAAGMPENVPMDLQLRIERWHWPVN
ncbi:hypothetical protein [Streptomyces vinaceus]|uniref:hypothetical protein n=1 Tax=Streptomyces vinaceus TaxID=1960 RepID=UPI0037FCED0D